MKYLQAAILMLIPVPCFAQVARRSILIPGSADEIRTTHYLFTHLQKPSITTAEAN